ncbi:MNIO family bufferin maturase [Aminobacter sp. LjRoot7]|uniref:MNIO family bufferin maturase n=1 Tax=Aminobacter sp. LjRoot7 TaxID=3342335 RepID=UPI003ECDD38C
MTFAIDGAGALPVRAGLGLKPEHLDEILTTEPDIGFFEVHAENYMGDGGAPHRALAEIVARYPLSLHGVGLSIGAERPLDKAHLARLKALVERYRPQSLSEHLAWSTHESGFLNDLLPLPYTKQTLERVSAHVDEVQQTVGRRMLLENPSTYILFEDSTIDEIDFLDAIAERTGCGLLLDVNNVMVSAVNHQLDAFAYVDRFPVERVGEIHLAGYDETVDGAGDRLLIDAHNSTVADDVFSLYRHTIGRTGPVPTLIEWDNDVPAFAVLLAEATRAEAVLDEAAQRRNASFVRRA